MARISVIMGIYNCASTLVEALDSLYAQTYQDFKIILCEDGSNDDTYEVAKRYAEKHDNILLLRNENNMGLNYTLNRCLEHVDTEYVARMDGDDISLPERFEKEVKFLDAHKEYGFVSGQMIYFDKNGDFNCGKENGEPTKTDFIQGRAFNHAPVMVRSKAYRDVGGYSVSKYLLRVEDQHLWLKLYKLGYKGYNIPEPIYKMRDDLNATRRRSFVNRRNEAYVKLLICHHFKLPWWQYVQSAVVPMLKWLVPTRIYSKLHRSRRMTYGE